MALVITIQPTVHCKAISSCNNKNFLVAIWIVRYVYSFHVCCHWISMKKWRICTHLMWECPLVGVPIASYNISFYRCKPSRVRFAFCIHLLAHAARVRVAPRRKWVTTRAILGASKATRWPARGPRGSFETHECNYYTPGQSVNGQPVGCCGFMLISSLPPTDPQTHFSNWLSSFSLTSDRPLEICQQTHRAAEPLPVTCRDGATTPLFIYISLRCSFSLELAQTNVWVVDLCRRREAKDKTRELSGERQVRTFLIWWMPCFILFRRR